MSMPTDPIDAPGPVTPSAPGENQAQGSYHDPAVYGIQAGLDDLDARTAAAVATAGQRHGADSVPILNGHEEVDLYTGFTGGWPADTCP